MSIQACAELVKRGDPDRFYAAMTARPADRAALFALAAFNLEVARAPWVTKEAMIAEMRLQWWLDVIDEIFTDGPARRHEVVDALAPVLARGGMNRAWFDALINARKWDIYPDAHKDEAAFEAYIQATSSNLTKAAFTALGGTVSDALEEAIADYGFGVGIANLFTAIPALENAQKAPLLDGTHEGVSNLATGAAQRLNRGRAVLAKCPKHQRAAFRAGWMARDVLTRAAKSPQLVGAGGLIAPEGVRKFKLLWASGPLGF